MQNSINTHLSYHYNPHVVIDMPDSFIYHYNPHVVIDMPDSFIFI